MFIVCLNGENLFFMDNYDSCLRVCANLYKQGSSIKDMEILRDDGVVLPVQIKHLIISC